MSLIVSELEVALEEEDVELVVAVVVFELLFELSRCLRKEMRLLRTPVMLESMPF